MVSMLAMGVLAKKSATVLPGLRPGRGVAHNGGTATVEGRRVVSASFTPIVRMAP